MAVTLSLEEVRVHLEVELVATHRRSYVLADVVLEPRHARALRLQRAAAKRLCAGDVAVAAPDLARYDALVGQP